MHIAKLKWRKLNNFLIEYWKSFVTLTCMFTIPETPISPDWFSPFKVNHLVTSKRRIKGHRCAVMFNRNIYSYIKLCSLISPFFRHRICRIEDIRFCWRQCGWCVFNTIRRLRTRVSEVSPPDIHIDVITHLSAVVIGANVLEEVFFCTRTKQKLAVG